MSTFNVGDAIIGQNAAVELEYNGMEGEVVGPLMHRSFTNPWVDGRTEGLTYLVRWANGNVRCNWPWQLRRKDHPPAQKREETGEWGLCPWRPAKVTSKTVPEQSI